MGACVGNASQKAPIGNRENAYRDSEEKPIDEPMAHLKANYPRT